MTRSAPRGAKPNAGKRGALISFGSALHILGITPDEFNTHLNAGRITKHRIKGQSMYPLDQVHALKKS